MSIKFEFDLAKSASNKARRGLDFIEAQALWQGRRVEFLANRVNGETRYAVIGKIKHIHHLVVVTYRGANVRIISARPASDKEGAIYEQQIKKI